MKLVSGFDWPVILWRVLGFVVSIGLAGGSAWWAISTYNEARRAEGREEVQRKWDKETAERKGRELEAANAALSKSERTLQETQNANDATAAEIRRGHVAVGTVRAERDRLQNVAREFEFRLAELSDSDAPGGGDAGGADARKFLGECVREARALAGEHGDLAESATTLAGQVRSLQRYARIVSGEPVVKPEGDRGDR
jgi:hypothetical protein